MDGTEGGFGTVHNRTFAPLGFTLIELMVTIALLSILLTLGVPSFLHTLGEYYSGTPWQPSCLLGHRVDRLGQGKSGGYFDLNIASELAATGRLCC
ncbi:Tfp pilus assembly protein FimT/FimU [Aeromonas sp. sif2416]|uniref:pilus assembly FimT family protein n=1 Tax=Aeromonas sp. sif2416 TaxID=2854793 RepID=UPI00352712EF